ncbi:hypothetical protein NQ314_007764 [Rhamnusium bicolor]|uniref:Uncharacterized protein n=1 Tax=Rhamnusium bicolor TaxID=1586634 RepID=A0AAV8YGN2_9CUCU|nr:hypothetical protein NQ314_007764 [Rhamnusium bicolor]
MVLCRNKEEIAIGLWSHKLSSLIRSKHHINVDDLYEDVMTNERIYEARGERILDAKGKKEVET